MDLRFAGLAPTAAEQAALARLLGAPLDGWRGNGALGERRHLLLPALHAVHDATGWIGRGAVDEIARRLDVAPADVYGVASFYGLFSLEERPPRVAHVCTDLACLMAGADRLVARLGPAPVAGDGPATWVESPCLGLCERAPAMVVAQYGDGHAEAVAAPVSAEGVRAALEEGVAAAGPERDVEDAVPQAG